MIIITIKPTKLYSAQQNSDYIVQQKCIYVLDYNEAYNENIFLVVSYYSSERKYIFFVYLKIIYIMKIKFY